MSADDAERYARVFEILSGAVGLQGGDLEDFLDQECGDDSALRSRVLELLAASSDSATRTGDVFAEASIEANRVVLDDLVTRSGPSGLPDRINDYEILRQIGRGGMGVVYEARQASPERRVALKVLSPSQVTETGLRRFRSEAEVLGRLQNPGIAQIYEASTFEGSHGRQPYFAMELVTGLPITEYAAEANLGTAERLGLIAELCDVIQYAHDQGVIHRDLKPANILVSFPTTRSAGATDATGVGATRLKVLDFGISRAVDRDLALSTLQTSTGQILGTISYMSPEQASGDPAAVDVRSDVYSLGVIAYELLGHALPVHSEGLMLHDAVRAIREDDPTGLGTLNRLFRGDIETIVGKALEKDRDRRYSTPADMAADIRRHLAHEPILASPPSTLYQLAKFTRRNKVLVGGVAATLLVAIVGAAVAANFALDSRRRANELERVAEYYASQLGLVDLGEMAVQLRESTLEALRRERERRGSADDDSPLSSAVVERLEQIDYAAVAMQFLDETLFTTARSTIETQFEDLPLVQARLFETLSTTMRGLGLVEPSAPLQERAFEIHRVELGETHVSTLRSMSLLGDVRINQRRKDDAAALLRPALLGQREALAAHSRELHDTLTWLGMCAASEEEALELKRELVAIALDRRGPDDGHTLHLMADICYMEGRLEDCAELRKRSVEAYRASDGSDGQRTLVASGNLATELRRLKRLEEAETYARAMIAGSRARYGERHPQTTNAMVILSSILRDAGRPEEAERHLRDALAFRQKYLGPSHSTTVEARRLLDSLIEEIRR